MWISLKYGSENMIENEFEIQTDEELEKESREQLELQAYCDGIELSEFSGFSEQVMDDWWDDHKSNNSSTNNINKIVEVKYKNDTYKTWTVKSIRPLITNFLKEKYPNSIIVPEINVIDITIFDNNSNEIIPVEIQKSPTTKKSGAMKFGNSQFENSIRKQIDDNIENYGKCWFFFDSEYLMYLQSKNIGIKTSINMTWLIKLMKENTLKVFVVRYDGLVRELTTKDFDFLKNISHTCIIGYDNDERILNRNKLKIFHNIINGYNFNQKEIDNFYNNFYNSNENNCYDFFRKNNDGRCKLYGNVLKCIGSLNIINKSLDMDYYDEKQHHKILMINSGIFEIFENSSMKFVDKFDICKYFPGYVRREKHWLTYKGNDFCYKTFFDMCKGMYKNSSTLFDY